MRKNNSLLSARGENKKQNQTIHKERAKYANANLKEKRVSLNGRAPFEGKGAVAPSVRVEKGGKCGRRRRGDDEGATGDTHDGDTARLEEIIICSPTPFFQSTFRREEDQQPKGNQTKKEKSQDERSMGKRDSFCRPHGCGVCVAPFARFWLAHFPSWGVLISS